MRKSEAGALNQSLSSRSSRTDPAAGESRYGYVIVASAFVMMAVMWTAFYSFGIFFKPVLKEFGWSRAVTAGGFSLCSFIQGLLSVVMGALADRFGPRIVMALCGVLLAAGYILMSQLHTLWQFYLFFSIVLGVGMGGSFAPLLTLTARWFTTRRGAMSGIVASGPALGAVIGPPLASTLIAGHGWRTSFAVLGITVLIVMLIGVLPLRRAPGHSDAAQPGGSIQYEGMGVHAAVRSWKFRRLFAAIFCLGFAVFGIMVHTAAHVTDLGFPPATGANVIAAMGIACIAGRIVLGRALDRIGSRKGLILGFAIMALALVLVAFSTSLGALYLFAVLFGFAFGACVTCESPIVADLFGLRSHGVLLGIVACGFTFGGGVGPFVMGHIFDVLGRYQLAFLLCAALSAAGLLLARTLKR
jgi:MFS family permease